MLVLTRKPGESIRIGEEIIVTVVEVKGNQVQVGINAPKGVTVHRGEVYDRIREGNIRAASLSADDFDRIRKGIE